MTKFTFNTLEDLKDDFIEICDRENLNISGVLSLLVFAFITDSCGIKKFISDEKLDSPFNLCYGDIR